MKTYTGTKVINAKPMTRGEYNVFRGWDLPANEDGSDEGYLVEYTDGGKANTTAYAGYVSWSPKDVFERAYKRVRLPHEQRVMDEKVELDTKLEALHNFAASDVFPKLSLAEQARLLKQLHVMEDYSSVLNDRIEAFQ